MDKQFISILKNDLKTVFRSKQHLVLIGSLLIYSVYINFIYIHTDSSGYQVFMYDQAYTESIADITYVGTEQELYNQLHLNKEAIGIIKGENQNKIIINDSGSVKINELKRSYAETKLKKEASNFSVRILGSNTFEVHKRIEMTSVVVFFEVTAISFLSIAALFFKEKQMGVIKVYSITPVKKYLLIFSKVIIFLILEICFVLLMGFINVGVGYFSTILVDVLMQILILSPLMVLLGFICSLLYNNFKQFIFAYTVIIIIFTSPVFLFVNTPLSWAGIKYFPTYHLYNNLHQAFFNRLTHNPLYYLIYGVLLAILFAINLFMINKEMRRS